MVRKARTAEQTITRLRDELLSCEIFTALMEANVLVEN